ncbi:MAG TPA: hypothetical protein DHW14_02160 [Clostridiales bacterium]|nr:hypothetical protein [Clostridiales bacterium]
MTPLTQSRYNFVERLSNNSLALYNTRTGSLIHVEPNEVKKVLSLLSDPVPEDPMVVTLEKEGFLVPYDCDELEIVKQWYYEWRDDRYLIHLTMLPAEACNFGCPYCFQFNRRNLLMKPSVYDGVFKYLENLVKENKRTDDNRSTMIKISWFGGEPTLAFDNIVAFHKKLKSLEDYGAKIRGIMVTNGYLLTVDKFLKLTSVGIKEFQVTLDGDAENHDKLRRLKNGKPTFQTIYDNLLQISQLQQDVEFRFSIRGNFLRTSIDSMHRLLEMFHSDFGDDPRFEIYFRPVYNFETTRDDIDEVSSEICGYQEGLQLQLALALKTMRMQRINSTVRMFDPLPRPTPSWCPAERNYAFIVGADGLLFLCDTWVGDEGLAHGRVSEDGRILLNEDGKKWRVSFFEENRKRCYECKLLPVCMGGCKRERLSRLGRPACYWSEEDIRSAMHRVIELNTLNDKAEPSQKSVDIR